MLHYDKILTSIGEFGLYQKRLWILLCLLAIPSGIHIPSVVFNNFTPNFRCAVPGLSNDTHQIQNTDHERLVKASIPYDQDLEQFSQCKIHTNAVSYSLHNRTHKDENETSSCHRWVYEDAESGMSQAVDFDLVCDREIHKVHNNMMVLIGILVGSLMGGAISDCFGRKKTAIIGTLAVGVLGGAMAFVHSIALAMVLRAFIIVACHTAFMGLFVLLVETSGVGKRSRATIMSMVGFSFGCFLTALVHFVFRDWRTAQLVQSIPILAFGLFWWLIQESPRWLLTKKRTTEAQGIIAYIAKVNGVEPPPEVKMLDGAKMMNCNTESTDEDDDSQVDVRPQQVKFWHMCSQIKIAIRISILCFCWIVINMVYYGLLLGIGDLIEGDLYVNFVLQASMELASHFICIFILEKTGRKKIFCTSMLLSGGSTLGIGVIILTKADSVARWLSILLYCIGKFCISLAFSLIYIMTTELLPTMIRNSGLGFCSFVARFSGIVSPYIASASLLIPGPLGEAFPVLLFGTMSLLSGLSALLLPETRNAKLPEAFDESSESDNDRKDDL